MRQLTPQEITHIFDSLCKILGLKAALLLPGTGRSREFNRHCKSYEHYMTKRDTLAEAASYGGYGVVILNRKGIHNCFYGQGVFKNHRLSGWTQELYKPPTINRAYIPQTLKLAYATIIIHELTHIQEFIEEGRINQEKVNTGVVDSLFVQQCKAINKYFGSMKVLNKPAESADKRDVYYGHKKDFSERYFNNFFKSHRVITNLEDEGHTRGP